MIRLTHITFPVLNFEESISFCKEWFQLEIHRDRRPATVWMTTPEQNKKKIPDFVFVLEEVQKISGHMNHFGFQVQERKELDNFALRAQEKNILVEGPIEVGGAVGTYVFIRDPNGHIWEMTCGQPLSGL